MIRFFFFLLGALGVLPLCLLVLLLPGTPITPVGGFYLCSSFLVVIGLLSAPWWQRSAACIVLGTTMLLGMVIVRIASPPVAQKLTLARLPGQQEPDWLNRIFDEQDAVLFGAQVGPMVGVMVSPREAVGLIPALSETYAEMRLQGVTPLSPFVMTALNQQRPGGFDALISEPHPNNSSKRAILFLHGFGGNFTLQCWLVAEAAARVDALTLCPSSGVVGDWWSPEGTAILRESLMYLQQRGVEHVYLAGLSNGGISASRLAEQFEAELHGLILISGANPESAITELPVLMIQGKDDERIPADYVERYHTAAGPRSTFLLIDGDHFVLLKQADYLQGVIADWVLQQEEQ